MVQRDDRLREQLLPHTAYHFIAKRLMDLTGNVSEVARLMGKDERTVNTWLIVGKVILGQEPGSG